MTGPHRRPLSRVSRSGGLRWRRGLAVAGAVMLTGGCAERRLTARPASAPTTGTWVSVWIAAGLAALVGGVLLTLPVWRERRGIRLAVVVLTVQTGALAVAVAVLTAVAARTGALVDRAPDAAASVSLVRLSAVDGDADLFSLFVLLIVVGGVPLVMLVALCTRFAAGDDVLERSTAFALLAIEAGGGAYAAVRLLLGSGGLPYVVPAVLLPVLVAAAVRAWPRRAPT